MRPAPSPIDAVHNVLTGLRQVWGKHPPYKTGVFRFQDLGSSLDEPPTKRSDDRRQGGLGSKPCPDDLEVLVDRGLLDAQKFCRVCNATRVCQALKDFQFAIRQSLAQFDSRDRLIGVARRAVWTRDLKAPAFKSLANLLQGLRTRADQPDRRYVSILGAMPLNLRSAHTPVDPQKARFSCSFREFSTGRRSGS